MNFRHLCVFDLETSSPDKRDCQIIQIAGAIIDDRRLKILDTFNSWIKPDPNAIGYDEKTIQWHADVRGIPIQEFLDMINAAPAIDAVWPIWVKWVEKYNKSKGNKSTFNAPIAAGYNINGFDIPIIDRYCKKRGPWNEKKEINTLFNPIYKYDLLQHMWFWTENIADKEVKTKLKLADNVKLWMGFSQEDIEAAHDALQDTLDVAKIMIKIFNAQRFLTQENPSTGLPRLQMKDAFKHETCEV